MQSAICAVCGRRVYDRKIFSPTGGFADHILFRGHVFVPAPAGGMPTSYSRKVAAPAAGQGGR